MENYVKEKPEKGTLTQLKIVFTTSPTIPAHQHTSLGDLREVRSQGDRHFIRVFSLEGEPERHSGLLLHPCAVGNRVTVLVSVKSYLRTVTVIVKVRWYIY